MNTISALREKFIKGEYTPVDLMAESLSVIEDKNTDINAFLNIFTELKEQAETAKANFANSGEKSAPLTGIPLAMKSNIMIKGERTSAASKILENYKAVYNATIVDRLRQAGAILLGNTNMDEFAMGGSTENSAFGVTKNPLDTSRVPGGSSGGSAAAVAMGAVPAAIGTDTGGSIRQPASFCGLVGFKPTYGAVSRYGLIAMGSSLDQAGPLTNSVEDTALLHRVMAGIDPLDMTTISDDTYSVVTKKDKYRIGIPRSFLSEGIDDDVMKLFTAQAEKLTAAGHEVIDIELPLFEQGLAAYYIVMPAEVSSNLARFDGIRYGLQAEGETLLDIYKNSRAEGFGPEVKRRILLGTYVLSAGYVDAYYGKAEGLRAMMREELNKVYESVDLIMTPTTATPAFTFGAQADPLSMYKQDIFTVPVNLTGVPALSVPMGTVDRGGKSLPVGVQYIAAHAGDERLFDFGIRTYDQQL